MSTAPKARDAGTSVALRLAAGAPVPADVAERLRAGGSALEVDCGGGLGCLALAEAFPAARVVGHDRDAAAVVRAQALARASGLDGRVSFALTGATRLERAGFDLATIRAVSRRSDALQILNGLRNALSPEGVCLVVEPWPESDRRMSLLASARGRDAMADALGRLARQAGFLRFELACREPSLDVYELRR
jgi:2-polyprenyl-3-methyl-5-hydroxy-6-metoxy-1,4-benzoquinol methylase